MNEPAQYVELLKPSWAPPSFWIKYLDIFGAEDGGVRYLNKNITSYVYLSNIHEAFVPFNNLYKRKREWR